MKRTPILPFLTLLLAVVQSCGEYLSVKPDQSLAVPSTLQDLQAILDGTNRMNGHYPAAGDIGSDFYYLEYSEWEGLSSVAARDTYRWAPEAENDQDWKYGYLRIFDANLVLEHVDGAERGILGEMDRKRIKGAALFFRGYTFFQLAQVFAPAYEKNIADELLGIPLRLDPDINAVTQRASLGQTYNRIVGDMKAAAALLPPSTGYKTRPSKAAAYGALAKIYLAMGEYQKAGLYADSCLLLNRSLMDYNSLDTNANNPIEAFNDEVLFHCTIIGSSGALHPGLARVDTNLFRKYGENDLRRAVFYERNADSTFSFKGAYSGRANGLLFSGIATDEAMLIRAECHARLGKTAKSIQVLNELLVSRWKTGTFVPFTAGDAEEALNLVLLERRKELAFRGGIRWSDLRRLNRDGPRDIALHRKLDGQTYELPPGDDRWTFLVPTSVVQATGIEQNER